MDGYVNTVQEATEFAKRMLAAANDYSIDGMDLDVEDGEVGSTVQVRPYGDLLS